MYLNYSPHLGATLTAVGSWNETVLSSLRQKKRISLHFLGVLVLFYEMKATFFEKRL